MSEATIDVSYVADLARLKLSADEISRFQQQLGDVVGYINKLQQLDVSGVPEAADDPSFINNLRQDVIQPSFTVDQALANAPQKAQDLIIAPKIVE